MLNEFPPINVGDANDRRPEILGCSSQGGMHHVRKTSTLLEAV